MTQPPQQAVYGWNLRPEVAPFVPKGASRVLEVGCGRGGFGRTLRELLGPDAFLTGIDPVQELLSTAEEAGDFDHLIEGYFPDALEPSKFDVIVFNDVLEHLVDPWQTLRDCLPYLATGGTVVAAIPNLRYAPVMWALARGDFEYVESGVLDRTHLRFFTHKGMRSLFQTSGFQVIRIEGVNNIVREHPHSWRGHRRKLRHVLGDTQWMQFVVVARPR